MRALKYFLADAAKKKAIVHHLDFIGAFLQSKVDIKITFHNVQITLEEL